MSNRAADHARLQFLARVALRESNLLLTSDNRVFDEEFTTARATSMDHDADLAERVEAFVSRFGRLQDTVGNKLLPALLAALGEPTGAVIDNLDRAERLGWIRSTDAWLSARQLRNQMVHEYIEDAAILASALRAGHGNVTLLRDAAAAMRREIVARGW